MRGEYWYVFKIKTYLLQFLAGGITPALETGRRFANIM
jgi:hypothetical protein